MGLWPASNAVTVPIKTAPVVVSVVVAVAGAVVARVLNICSLVTYRLGERQRGVIIAQTKRSIVCSSSWAPFRLLLTFPGCFATCVPFGCLDSPDTSALRD